MNKSMFSVNELDLQTNTKFHSIY